MVRFIALSCPACGAKLTITDDKNRFICEYCSNEQFIDRLVHTFSQDAGDEIPAQKPEVVRESPSELAMSRLGQEISELEAVLAQIGIPRSKWEILTSSTCSILYNFIFTGALFFGAWAAREIEWFEGIPLLLMQFTFVVIGIGILASAVGEFKNGAERISNCRSDSEKRERVLEQLNKARAEMEKRQTAAFNAQVGETSIELASEHALRRLKNEIAGYQDQMNELDKPETITSILVSTFFGVILIALISNWLLSWASSQSLPAFIVTQLSGEAPLPYFVWWILGISGILFALLPLKTIEGGIQKLNAHKFYHEELKRFEDLLAPKLDELEKHQNTLSQLLT